MTEPLSPGAWYLHAPPARTGPLGFLHQLGSLGKSASKGRESRAAALIRWVGGAVGGVGPRRRAPPVIRVPQPRALLPPAGSPAAALAVGAGRVGAAAS